MSDQGGVFFACGSSGCVDSLDNALTSILCENLKISRDKAIEMKIEWKDSGKIKVESFGA
jgi:sulfite reductase alpha subunit-like flavoprotein